MFDDTKEPVDIFADVDGGKGSGASRPTSGFGTSPRTPDTSVTSHGPSRLLLALIVVVILGLAGGSYYFFFVRKTIQPAAEIPPVVNTAVEPQQPQAQQPVEQQPPVQPPVNAAVEPQPPATPVVAPDITIDTDHDGLTDQEETVLGTNPNLADTDNDGLSDYDEVKIWHTDPLKADTDGDGYPDGQEVKGGYNPNGPGKLPPLPAN